MKQLFFFAAVAILLAGCTAPKGELTPEQIQSIKVEAQQATATFIDAIEKNEINAIIGSFHNSEKTRVVFDAESHDYEGFLELANKILPGVDHQVMDTKEEVFTIVAEDCFIHFWTGFNGMYFKDGSEMEMENFFLTYVYKKFDGKWMIVHAHESWKEIPMPPVEEEMIEEQ